LFFYEKNNSLFDFLERSPFFLYNSCKEEQVNLRLKEVEVLASPTTKIKAIKAYREITGKDLKTSKEDVEYFMAHREWRTSDSPEKWLSSLAAVEVLASPTTKIKAIKAYREITGKDLRTSKEDVEYFMREGSWPESDPWVNINDSYKVGDLCTGKISNIVEFGVFVELEPRLVGLIHKSDLCDPASGTHVYRKSEILSIRILSVDAPNRRLGLAEVKNEADEKKTSVEISPPEIIGKADIDKGVIKSDYPQAMEVLPKAAGSPPSVLSEVEATFNLEQGVLFLSRSELFFCQKGFEEWCHSKTWSLIDIVDYDVKTSFMDTDLSLVLQNGTVRFSNLDTEKSQVFIAQFKQFLPVKSKEPVKSALEEQSASGIEPDLHTNVKPWASFNKYWALLIFLIAALIGLVWIIDNT